MKSHHLTFALALAAVAGVASAYQQPMGVQAADDAGRKTPSTLQLRDSAARALQSIDDIIGKRLMLSCNRCRSGFALKVVEQAMQKQPALSSDQYAEVERLRAEGQALYDQEKYVESLELLRKAQSILGIDASGDPITPPIKQTSGASAEPLPNR
ncbi:MAG TPA: hypothetical protein VMH26_00990 [Burkholderiales bacterium]|nr:hypothetical protein [Burkholderiales bacterium]